MQRRGRAKLTTFSTAWNPGLFPVRGAMRGSCDQAQSEHASVTRPQSRSAGLGAEPPAMRQ